MIFPTLMVLSLVADVVCAQEPPTPKEVDPPETPEPASPAKVTPNKTAQSRYFEEQFRQLRGEIEGIKEAYDLQLRKSVSLEAEVKRLRTANESFKRDLALKFASNKDIDELAGKLMELDKNRRNDLAVTNQQIDAVLKIVTKLAATPIQPRNPGGGNVPPPPNIKFREHVVQAGEFLSTLQEAYNKAFKDEGLKGRITQSQILKANPGLKANRLLIGQKLRIPLPGEIN